VTAAPPRYDIISDMTKAPRFGFPDCLDSEAMFFDMFER